MISEISAAVTSLSRATSTLCLAPPADYGDKNRHGHDAAVATREFCSLPEIPYQHLAAETGKRRARRIEYPQRTIRMDYVEPFFHLFFLLPGLARQALTTLRYGNKSFHPEHLPGTLFFSLSTS